MITSIFRKSTLLNYSIVIIGVVVFFFLYQIHDTNVNSSGVNIFEKATVLGTIFASIFTANFIVKKNGLSKDSAYTVFFYFLLLLFFPSLWSNFNLILSNFFILLANDPNSLGYILNFGTEKVVAARERRIRNYILMRRLDLSRIIFKRAGFSDVGRTAFWIVRPDNKNE